MGRRAGHLQEEEGPALAGPGRESGRGSQVEGQEVQREAIWHGQGGVRGQEAPLPVQGEPGATRGIQGHIRLRECVGDH